MKTVFNLILICLCTSAYGQLGFCTGSKGLPIFFENFGSGTTYGPPLTAGTTTYDFSPGVPNDGEYTLFHKTNPNSSWHNSLDHTPDSEPDGVNGKSLIVNAGFSAGSFYERTVSGLCVNTTFEFTAWLMNIYNSASNSCSGSGIPIDVKFEIWDITETILMTSGSTGAITGTSSPQWTQYGLTFTTAPGQTSVILKMINNGVGGCGNDLAIDDIMFRSCGEMATITSPQAIGSQFSLCGDGNPANLGLEVQIGDPTVHVFQWQESPDNTVWADIPGENSTSYTTTVIGTKYFRVKVAEDAVNLANPFCFTVSDIFSVSVTQRPSPPVSDGNLTICANETIPALAASVAAGESVDWFDAPSGGNPISANALSFTPNAAGTFYAESYVVGTDCRSLTRTAVSLTINPQPIVSDVFNIILCQDSFVELDAGINNVSYQWSANNAITRTITVTTPGNYSVVVTNQLGCSSTKNFTVVQKDRPVISSVTNQGSTVTITTLEQGDYEYSLDGIIYQNSNVFYEINGGLITAHVREIHDCGEDEMQFLLILIPQFFTPNFDGSNDYFTVPGFQFMPNARISIFDRYGKLITVLHSENPAWDGTLNNERLPSTDYWYDAIIDEYTHFKGHFSLIR